MDDGPAFEDLRRGQVFDAPALTLTGGLAAVHQAIVGDRLRLPLDDRLAARVTGGSPVAHPALVWNVAIGHSTVVTRRVVANLFYRGLGFHRVPLIGDTLRTTTEVVALRQNRPRPDRRPTGLAALRIVTVDQDDRPVLDFWRCAMLPLRDPDLHTGHSDDLDRVGRPLSGAALAAAIDGWDLAALRRAGSRPRVGPVWLGASGAAPRPGPVVGQVLGTGAGDVVSNAPELARLTLNIAAVHHDAGAAGGRRLVYGGHTIALALSQATRVLPDLVTVLGWHSCDHLGPVYEGDTVTSQVSIERIEPLPAAALLHLRSTARARTGDGAPRDVLDWRYVAVTG
jgi:acyl dehydratase